MIQYVIRMWILFTLMQVFFQSALASDRVRLRDVEVITLYNGRMTNGRRSSPVPQLKCAGGSARCSFVPQAVQCYNRGSDGYDVQWECKTDMDNKYRFGHINVNCEGYDYPDDPYILQGSCGLVYTIELAEHGRGASDYDSGSYYHDSRGYNKRLYSGHPNFSISDLIMVVIVAVIVYMIYSTCVSYHAQNDSAVPPTAPPPYSEFRNTYQAPGADIPPPPYAPDAPGLKREYTQQGSTANSAPAGSGSSDSSSGYGFWSGAASGGLLGYLLGSRNSGSRYYNTPYYNNPYYHHRPHSRGSGNWFGSNWFGGGRSSYSGYSSNFGSSSSGSSSRSSSGSRTASGMGGTSRR